MDVAIDDSGNAAAVWTQYDGFYVNIWASQFTKATSTWSTAEKLENAALDAVMPSVDMSAGGAQVIWTQSDGSLNHMYAATLTPAAGTLSDPYASRTTLAPAAAPYAPTGLSAARASISPEMISAIDFAMSDEAGGSTGRKKSTKADHDLLLATYDPLMWL
jgi:hypothetical protein